MKKCTHGHKNQNRFVHKIIINKWIYCEKHTLDKCGHIALTKQVQGHYWSFLKSATANSIVINPSQVLKDVIWMIFFKITPVPVLYQIFWFHLQFSKSHLFK